MSRDAEIRTQLARQWAEVELSGEIQWEEEVDQAKGHRCGCFWNRWLLPLPGDQNKTGVS